MAKYLVSGSFKKGNKTRSFQKEIEAKNEKLACELLFALLGSNGGIKRSAITITSIEKI